jgi:MFS family permease
LQDIKVALDLSDSQLGLLGGIAFSFFYALMGLPIARLADRGLAVEVIALTIALSSISVALCGAAHALVPLALARIGVAFGDAGTLPPAQSLIASHFSRGERPRATAIFFLGGSVSAAIGYSAVGWLIEFYGWRVTFAIIGLPGLAFAGLAWIALDRFRRSRGFLTFVHAHMCSLASWRSSLTGPGYVAVCFDLWLNRTFRSLLFGQTLLVFLGSGVTQWNAVFFVRSYGLGTGELGIWLGAITTVALVGTYAGGMLASRYAASNERLQLYAVSIALVGYSAVAAGIYLAPSYQIALAMKAACALGAAAMMGPVFSVFQTVVPSTVRATALAFLYLVANLVGMGLGPFFVGALSDTLHPVFGDESLRYALLATCPGYVLSAWYFWRASRTVTREIARLSDEQDDVELDAGAAR